MKKLLLIALVLLLQGCTKVYYDTDLNPPYVYDSCKKMYVPNHRYMEPERIISTNNCLYQLGFRDGKKNKKKKFKENYKYLIGYRKGQKERKAGD